MSNETEKMQFLERITAGVYICQIFTFFLAGLPLLIGVAINFIKKDAVAGTWLESHFEWQIKSAWVSLAGFALAGLTTEMDMSIGLFILLPTLVFLIYRIVIGWNALKDKRNPNENGLI